MKQRPPEGGTKRLASDSMASWITYCDICGKRCLPTTCAVCGRQHCRDCCAYIEGCITPPCVCKECREDEGVMAIVMDCSDRVTPLLAQRREALKKYGKAAKRRKKRGRRKK